MDQRRCALSGTLLFASRMGLHLRHCRYLHALDLDDSTIPIGICRPHHRARRLSRPVCREIKRSAAARKTTSKIDLAVKSHIGHISTCGTSHWTHVKSHIGHISTTRETLPTNSITCQPRTANSLTLSKPIGQGIMPRSLMYCFARNQHGSVPSLESFQRFAILPGNLTRGEVAKRCKRTRMVSDSWLLGSYPLTFNGYFREQSRLLGISVEALEEYALVGVYSAEKRTFYVLSQVPAGTFTGIHSHGLRCGKRYDKPLNDEGFLKWMTGHCELLNYYPGTKCMRQY